MSGPLGRPEANDLASGMANARSDSEGPAPPLSASPAARCWRGPVGAIAQGLPRPISPLAGEKAKTWAWRSQVLGFCQRGANAPVSEIFSRRSTIASPSLAFSKHLLGLSPS